MPESLTEVSLSLRGKVSSGEDITPERFPLGAVVEQLALLQAVFGDDAQDISMVEGSLKVIALVLPASLGFSTLSYLQQGQLDKLPNKVARVVQKMDKLTVAHGYEFNLALPDKPHYLVLNKEAAMKKLAQKNTFIPMTGIVEGEITDAGGLSEPNIHLKTADKHRVVIAATKEQLRSIHENLLYQHKRVKVHYAYNVNTGEKKDFKLIEILSYQGVNMDALKSLQAQGAQIWKDVPDSEAWVRELRS